MINHSSHPSSQGFRLIAALALIVLLTGLACNATLPGVPTVTAVPQPTSGATPTLPPQPTPVPANLPAALVESAPLPDSEIGLKQPFIFYFNQAMEKGSVEAALQAQPPIAGSFKWLNDYSVSFTPDQPLPKDTPLTVTISTKARAANGLALNSPVELAYRTAAGFAAVERLPLPDANSVGPNDAIVATFNRAIVPLGGNSSQTPAAFTLDPPGRGRSEWLNTSTYIFYPNPGLAGGVKYTVHLNKDLMSADGIGWAAMPLPDWSFTTRLPSLTQVQPADKSRVFLDDPIVLTFDQAMDPASFSQNFTFTGPDGQPVAGKITWNDPATVMTFKPDNLLGRASIYTLSLSGKAQSSGGTPLGTDFTDKLTTVAPMAVAGMDPGAGSLLRVTNGFGSLHFFFTSPLPSSGSLDSYFSFDPPVDNFSANQSQEGTDLYLSGTFDGNTEYALTISSDLADRWGQKLKSPYTLNFKTASLDPALAINIADGYSGSVFLTPDDTVLPAQATNIKNLAISYGSLSLNDFTIAANIAPFDRLQKFTGPRLTKFKKPL
ncbi:MAG TPA: Ig-like domain-containing protein, partial [Anaerolineaceae bacterium]|nr:Ig-like domain-containing protein [Anaerolineaceae bacterium]